MPSFAPPRRGVQTPRIRVAPASAVRTYGHEAARFVADHGLVLDPWQRETLAIAMGERADGQWSAFEMGVIVPRQNGKGSIIEARELAGLFLLDEQLIIHTAHLYKTSHEAFLRVSSIVKRYPDLMRRVARFPSTPGMEGIELKSGARLQFMARTGGSGRGYSADCVFLDEAYKLPDTVVDALIPALSARPNAQVWYLSSAGMEDSDVLDGVRARAIADPDGAEELGYCEWSAPEDCDPADPDAWAMANPALGYRITEETIGRELRALTAEGFARERLGIWASAGDAGVFPAGSWASCMDAESHGKGPVTLAVEVAEDRSWACIGVATTSTLGGTHLAVVDYREATRWVGSRVRDLCHEAPVAAVVVQPTSPAGSLIPGLLADGVPVVEASGTDYARACGLLYDAVAAGEVVHVGQAELDMAVRFAARRKMGDAYVWNRRNSRVDISPLVSVTLAAWGHDASDAGGQPNLW